VSGYMPETQPETQTWTDPEILRYGKGELGLHLVQKVGEALQFKQLESQGEQSRVELLLYVVSGQLT